MSLRIMAKKAAVEIRHKDRFSVMELKERLDYPSLSFYKSISPAHMEIVCLPGGT